MNTALSPGPAATRPPTEILMSWKRRLTGAAAALAAAALVAGGCDDRDSTGASRDRSPGPAAATVPVSGDLAQGASSRDAATHPVETQPAAAYLSVEGRPLEFPPARLRLTRTDDGVRALLFSDDPKNAVSSDYKGNSFYFDVPLRVADAKDVGGAEYFYRAKTSEPEDDSPNGIFLNGMSTHLQPQDVAIRFDGESPRVVAKLVGRFLVVNSNGESPRGQFAAVTATLFTTVEVKDE